jgi:hypothetical protein
MEDDVFGTPRRAQQVVWREELACDAMRVESRRLQDKQDSKDSAAVSADTGAWSCGRLAKSRASDTF